MGTYAVYRVWAGVRLEDLKTPVTNGMKIGALRLGYIYMHGSEVGFGVPITELGWVSKIARSNEFDTSFVATFDSALQKVKEAFKKTGISPEPKLYHHIDLGG